MNINSTTTPPSGSQANVKLIHIHNHKKKMSKNMKIVRNPRVSCSEKQKAENDFLKSLTALDTAYLDRVQSIVSKHHNTHE